MLVCARLIRFILVSIQMGLFSHLIAVVEQSDSRMPKGPRRAVQYCRALKCSTVCQSAAQPKSAQCSTDSAQCNTVHNTAQCGLDSDMLGNRTTGPLCLPMPCPYTSSCPCRDQVYTEFSDEMWRIWGHPSHHPLPEGTATPVREGTNVYSVNLDPGTPVSPLGAPLDSPWWPHRPGWAHMHKENRTKRHLQPSPSQHELYLSDAVSPLGDTFWDRRSVKMVVRPLHPEVSTPQHTPRRGSRTLRQSPPQSPANSFAGVRMCFVDGLHDDAGPHNSMSDSFAMRRQESFVVPDPLRMPNDDPVLEPSNLLLEPDNGAASMDWSHGSVNVMIGDNETDVDSDPLNCPSHVRGNSTESILNLEQTLQRKKKQKKRKLANQKFMMLDRYGRQGFFLGTRYVFFSLSLRVSDGG